ncbi:MAG: hypothetical protein RL347_853 [Actinomycetota bacterium]
MLTPPRILITAAATVALAASAIAVPTAAAETPRVEGSNALKVSYLESGLGYNRLQVLAPLGAVLGPGDVIVTTFPYDRWERFGVYVDPESSSLTVSVKLSPGVGCSDQWPSTTRAPLPVGAIYCGYADSDSRDVEFDLRGSTYSGGELTLINTTSIDGSLSGSPFADNYYGGPGSDSVDGAGGDDVIFGGGGDDWLLGGDGRDLIDGEGGSDVIYGDAGADTITVDEDGEADWVNCNNFDRGVQNTDNDPDNPPINRVFADKGLDRVTDCGVAAAPAVKTYPTVSGIPVTGQPFSAKAGTWEGKALLLSYAWFACPTPTSAIPFLDDDDAGDCTEVAARDGDRGLTYTPKASDTGRYLVLRATARNNSGFAVAVSGYSGAVKGASLTPGPVRELSAKLAVTKVRGTRTLSVTVTWKPPVDPGPGIKHYVVEVDGLDTPRVVSSELAHTFTVAPYPRNRVITVKVSAQGPKGASQQGPTAEVSKRTPRV